MDWKQYAKEERIEGDLEKNRKDGYLAKKKFLEGVQEVEYEHQKKIEKH